MFLSLYTLPYIGRTIQKRDMMGRICSLNEVYEKRISATVGSVGIATRYELDYAGIDPGGVDFSAPVHTGSGAHPSPCTMGTGTLSWG